MNRPGDWKCRSCQYHNFQRRESCPRCGEPKSGGGGGGGADFGMFGGGGGGGGVGGGGGGMIRGGSNSFGFTTGSDVRPGDWYCSSSNCGAHNFASRSSCFKCGALKDSDLASAGFDCSADISRSRAFVLGGACGGGGRPGWKSGDWICTRSGCNEHNFASRIECFRCNAPRDSY